MWARRLGVGSKWGRRRFGTGKNGTMVLPRFEVERYWGWDNAKMSLSSSECETMTLKELLRYGFVQDKPRQDWDNLSLGYAMQCGNPRLREVVARNMYRGGNINADHVTIVAPQEGIYLAMLALLSKGDTVIVSTPCYQSLYSIASSMGCNVIKWRAERYREQWKFNVEMLEHLLQTNPSTKLVVIQFPNNPTGAHPTREEAQRIVDLCRSRGVWVFHDEMYQGLEHGGDAFMLPAMANMYPDLGISLGGLSKSFGLPGLRVGWLVSLNPSFVQRVRELKDYTTICTASPSEFLATIAVENHEAIQQRCKQIVLEGLEIVKDFVADNSHVLEWTPPKGGTFSVVTFKRLPPPYETAQQYCDDQIRQHKMMILPCSLFEMDDSSVRICYGTKGVKERLESWKSHDPELFLL